MAGTPKPLTVIELGNILSEITDVHPQGVCIVTFKYRSAAAKSGKAGPIIGPVSAHVAGATSTALLISINGAQLNEMAKIDKGLDSNYEEDADYEVEIPGKGYEYLSLEYMVHSPLKARKAHKKTTLKENPKEDVTTSVAPIATSAKRPPKPASKPATKKSTKGLEFLTEDMEDLEVDTEEAGSTTTDGKDIDGLDVKNAVALDPTKWSSILRDMNDVRRLHEAWTLIFEPIDNPPRPHPKTEGEERRGGQPQPKAINTPSVGEAHQE